MVPVKFTFHSLKSREWEVIFEFGGKLTAQPFPMDADYSFLDPIGVNFVDLPKAIDAARAAGLTNYSIALLSQVVTMDRGKVAAWRIGRFVVDASTGKVIPPSSLPDESIEAEFRQMQTNRNSQQTNGGQNADSKNGCHWVYNTAPSWLPAGNGKFEPLYLRHWVCP